MEQTIGIRARERLTDGSSHYCNAHRKNGEPCYNFPIAGGTVCRLHGGASPLAKQAARERLLMLVEPALEVLYRATRSAPPCPHCQRSDADRDPVALKAAQVILDRTGFGRHETLTIESQSQSAPYAQYLTSAELATVSAIIAAAKARMNPEITDGVLVEETAVNK